MASPGRRKRARLSNLSPPRQSSTLWEDVVRSFRLLALGLGLFLAGCSTQHSDPMRPGAPAPRPGFSPVLHVSFVEDSLFLKPGAGTLAMVRTQTLAGADTTSKGWEYQWIANPVLITLDNPTTVTASNRFYVTGIGDGNQRTALIRVYVTHKTTLENGTVLVDTLGTSTMRIGLERIALRDIILTADIYHLVRTVNGTLASQLDSVQALFSNNDKDRSPLRAGIFSVAGSNLSERHTLEGQDYHGIILFKVPQSFDLVNAGPERDPNSQVPRLQLSVPGPRNELLLSSPVSRNPANRTEALPIQWTGGLGDGTIDIEITDALGYTMRVVAADNGRLILPAEQVRLLSSGIAHIVLRRSSYQTLVDSFGLTKVTSNINIFEITNSSFAVQ